TLAFESFKILGKMIPSEPPHSRPTLIRIQETVIEIVCRKLLGDRYRSGPPTLTRREGVPPEPMDPYRERLIDGVEYWLDHDRQDMDGDIGRDQLRRLEDALKTAQADRETIKRARRSYARKRSMAGAGGGAVGSARYCEHSPKQRKKTMPNESRAPRLPITK